MNEEVSSICLCRRYYIFPFNCQEKMQKKEKEQKLSITLLLFYVFQGILDVG